VMDERALFERFHEALDMEPRPGAYERLRTQLITSKPVALKSRPRFQMRFTRMGLRMAAALTAVLIAIALIATFIAVHNRPVGEVPANSSANLTAYRALIDRDYNAMNASTSNHCFTIDDTGCAAATVPVIAALQKWAGDINAFPNTPAQYRAIATTLRAHLLDVARDLSSAVAFQKTGNDAAFNLAIQHGLFERAWIDPATSTIEGVYPREATGSADAISQAKRVVHDCVANNTPPPAALPCNRLANFEQCPAARALACEGDTEEVETQIQTLLVGMAQNPAPNAQAAGYAQLQTDLARADASLLAVHDALLGGGAGNLTAAQNGLLAGMESAQRDIATI
jgi:hypothetical protein